LWHVLFIETGSVRAHSMLVVWCQDCGDPDVACHRMQCVLGEILPGKGITLRLRFRLWNHTFTEVLLSLESGFFYVDSNDCYY